jgi:DNA replication protein DnaC
MEQFCDYCNKMAECEPSFSLTHICFDCSGKIRDTWQRMIDKMGYAYSQYYFDKFEVNKTNKDKYDACVAFANQKEISDTTPFGLMLFSKDAGNGKSHLGVSTVRQWLITNKPTATWPITPENKQWCITTDHQILVDVMKTYKDGAWEDEDDVVKRYGAYPILMIDDLGKHTPRDLSFTQRILFQIINIRWICRKVTVLTTNKSGSELQEHLGDYSFDRICGMTRDKVIHLTGRSYRRQEEE